MIELLRAQVVSLITKSAQAGLEKLDKNSALAHQLKDVDVKALLEDCVRKICNEMSYFEMGRIAALAAEIKCGFPDKKRTKEEIKKIAKEVVGRVEKRSGDLEIPFELRDLLFSL